jgi:hypothetical protein
MVKMKAATSINLGYIGEQASPITYAYGGDMNGDGVRFNDLLFIPNNGSDIRFSAITGTTPLLKHSNKQHLKLTLNKILTYQQEVSMLNAMDLLYRCYID